MRLIEAGESITSRNRPHSFVPSHCRTLHVRSRRSHCAAIGALNRESAGLHNLGSVPAERAGFQYRDERLLLHILLPMCVPVSNVSHLDIHGQDRAMSLLPIMMWLNILSSPPPTARPADVLRRGGHYDEVRLARNTWSVSDRAVRRDSLSGQAATRTAHSRRCLPIAWFGTRRLRMPQLR